MNNYAVLFKNKNFFLLWLGQCASALGDRFTQMSLLTIVMVIFQDSGERMAWITFYSLLPFLIFGQIFGIVSDRTNRKYIMIIADLARAALVAAIPFVYRSNHSIQHLYLVVFCLGTLSAFFSPAKMAIVPLLVDKQLLLGANSLIASTGMIATLLGTLIAGLVIKATGVNYSFFINAFTFLFSALLITGIFLAKDLPSKSLDIRGIFSSIQEGLKYINRHQLLWRILQLNAVFAFCSSCFYITILNYSTAVLGLSSAGYGVLLAALGAGLCSGAFLLGRRIGALNYNRILVIGFALLACMNILFIGRPNFWVSLLFLILGGGGASLIMITLDSLLQRLSPDSLRANIFGARGIATNAIFLISLIITGKLLTLINSIGLFAFMGGLSLLVACIIFFSDHPLGYLLLKGILRLILKLFFRLKVKGLDHLPAHGKVILAGNHTSLLDGVVVMAAYPRRIYFLVAESVFKVKLAGWLARQCGFIPINRGGFNKESIQEAVRILEGRSAIGIFPEGRIAADGRLSEGKRGVALLAQKTNTPIIPFAIEGAYFAWPLSKKYPSPHPVEITFGEPLGVGEYEETEELAQEVMSAIKKIKTDLEKEGILEVEPNVIIRHLIDFG